MQYHLFWYLSHNFLLDTCKLVCWVDQMYRFFCWALTSFSKIAFQIWFIMTLNLIFDSDFLLLSRQVQTLSFILFRKKPIWHSQPRYAERNVCTSEKVILFHQNVFRKVVFSYQKLPKLFVRKNYFFPWFCKFSISEDILKFTLFRKVLLPLNEKYSGL